MRVRLPSIVEKSESFEEERRMGAFFASRSVSVDKFQKGHYPRDEVSDQTLSQGT